MKAKLLQPGPGHAGKTFALIFETGDEVMAGLQSFADSEKLAASHFTAVGALRDVTLAWFDWDKKNYKKIPLHEQVEVLALVGDVTVEKGRRKVHAHLVVGTSDGNARGGHLLEGHVRPTLEVFLEETESELRRSFDAEAQISLIRAT
mgnify:FL=1